MSDSIDRAGPIAILGAGLLGGSLALALQGKGDARLWARRDSVRDAALARSLAATSDLEEALDGARLIVLCTPVGAMPRLLLEIAAADPSPDALVTDVGSVKTGVVDQMDRMAMDTGLLYLSSHPMAGSENSGWEAARRDLYQGARCILTPGEASNPMAVRRLTAFWEELGCRVLQMSVTDHDRHMAAISHMPHLLSAALVNATLGRDPDSGEVAAGGFRDMTRIAAGPPEMWREILLQNAAETAAALRAQAAQTLHCATLLEDGASDDLLDYLTKARDLRHSCFPPHS